jgi:raffinose/stachyose/melibiose transport system permease protein
VTTTDSTPGLVGRALARPAGLRPVPSSTRASRVRRKWYEIIGLTTPALVVYSTFVLAPMGFAVFYSLFKWKGAGWPTADDFIGLDNYFKTGIPPGVLFEPSFRHALMNNAIILFGSLIIQGPTALGIALLLNRRFRGRALFRLLVFVPYVIAEVTVGIMWGSILGHGGVADATLKGLGLSGLIQPWLADQNVAIWSVLGVLTWKYVGFAIILFLAGLSNVPDELTEAAAIDGATWWQIQRHVTIPLLAPTIRIWVFLSMIGSLQVFDVVYVTVPRGLRQVGGGTTMATYMVDNGFFSQLWGFGSAIAVTLFVIAFVVALLFQRFFLRRDLEGALTTGRMN